MANSDFEFTLIGSTYAVTGYKGSTPEVKIPSSYNGRAVTAIGTYTFYSRNTIKTVIIPNTVTHIENYAFKNCGLESVSLPNSVTYIGSGVFEGCLSLKSVKLSDKIKRIENSAFWQCVELDGIVLPDCVTEIGIRAFYECRSLTSIVIPSSVTSIEDDAFRSCQSLKRVVFEKPEGWYIAASPADNFGQEIPAEELEYPIEAAKRLQAYFVYGNFWKRK